MARDSGLSALVLAAFCACTTSPERRIGETCSEDDECVSGRCDELVCKQRNPLPADLECTHDLECASEVCSDEGRCAGRGVRLPGEACTDTAQCARGECIGGICVASSNDAGADSNPDAGADSSPDAAADSSVDGPSIPDISVDQPLDILPPAVSWQQFGAGGNEGVTKIVLAPNRDVVVVGSSSGETFDFAGVPLSMPDTGANFFIARLDAAGNHRWSHGLGGPSYDAVHSLAIDAQENTVISGVFRYSLDLGGDTLVGQGDKNTLFLASFDSGGNHRWSHALGTAAANALAFDNNGEIAATGTITETVDFGNGAMVSAGERDVFVARFDDAGKCLWSKHFGNSLGEAGNGLGLDGDGKTTVVGYFQRVIDFGGGPLTSAGRTDAFVVQLDRAGAHSWSKRFGDTEADAAQTIAVDASGQIIVGGTFANRVDFGGGELRSANDETDIFLASYGASGRHLWSQHFGGNQDSDAPVALALDGAGQFLLIGKYLGTVTFGSGVSIGALLPGHFAARFTRAGQNLWAMKLDAMPADVAGLAGHGVMAGNFSYTLTHGSTSLPSAGGRDIFVGHFSH